MKTKAQNIKNYGQTKVMLGERGSYGYKHLTDWQ